MTVSVRCGGFRIKLLCSTRFALWTAKCALKGKIPPEAGKRFAKHTRRALKEAKKRFGRFSLVEVESRTEKGKSIRVRITV